MFNVLSNLVEGAAKVAVGAVVARGPCCGCGSSSSDSRIYERRPI